MRKLSHGNIILKLLKSKLLHNYYFLLSLNVLVNSVPLLENVKIILGTMSCMEK